MNQTRTDVEEDSTSGSGSDSTPRITANMLNFLEFLNNTLAASGTCLSFSTSYEKLKNTTIDPSESSRQWMYQSCQEFGYFQVASDDDSTRVRSKRIDLEYHRNLCKALYDVDVDIEPKKLHYMQDDMIGTNIIWTNGDVDPWMELSITPVNGTTTQRRNVEVKQDGRVDRQHWKVLLINNGSHCSDLSTPDDDTDSESLKNARNYMREEINGLSSPQRALTLITPTPSSSSSPWSSTALQLSSSLSALSSSSLPALKPVPHATLTSLLTIQIPCLTDQCKC